jgi:hypothetical protein
VITVAYWHLPCNVVNGLLCCDDVMLLQRIFCGVVSCVCVLRCACMVLGVSHCIKTFFLPMLMLLMLCVDQLITNNFYFYFFLIS